MIVPSILAADRARLYEQARDVVDAGASALHVDVMDGRFVPSHGYGPETVAGLRHALAGRDVLLDVHLMVERPERHIASFAAAGAGLITFHVEASADPGETIGAIRDAGCAAGIALRPGTPLSALDPVAELVDVVLCMTVEPGFGGQPFIESSPFRIRRIAATVPAGTRIEVDGGIDTATARRCATAGATLLVAGTAVFGADDPAAAFAELASADTKDLV
jgi:ribulose-phosphate 3-epimerase